MIAYRAFRNTELDFSDIVEKRQVLIRAIGLAGDLAGELILLRGNGKEVKTKADVLCRSHDGLSGSG